MKLIQKIFSMTNEKYHKVIQILGIKFKFKNKIKELKLELENIKNKNIEYGTKLGKIQNQMKKIIPMDFLRNFEIHLVEHCNLNCQCCNHYSPLAEKIFLDKNVFLRDITRMSELTNKHVEYINLLGGEPLLHPDLLFFLEQTRIMFPNTTINLVSNGILLEKQNKNFWEICKKYNITIVLTQYPIKINWSYIKEKFEKYQINNVIWGNENGIKHSWHFPLDLEGKQDIRSNFLNCEDANNCIFLREGKLFTCVTPPNIHHFNKYFNKNIPVTNKDYIDIYKVKNINEILEFLAKPIPFCKYCNVNARKFDLKWKTTKRNIEEWVTTF